ncbi:hypothetical protein Q5752_002564 [Cryptotrichosporon argae]
MAENTVPIQTLLVTVFESIIEVFLLCMAGYVLARSGVTDKATQRKLNVINVSLFTPALLFSKVAFSLTPAKLKEMWIIPLGFVLVTGVSAAVAWALAKVLKLKKSQRAFAMCAAMFQNSNSLPIALIQSLVVEVPGLRWGDDDTRDQMLGRALTYMVLYSTLGMMLRWSWGVRLLSAADDDVPDEPAHFPSNVVDSPNDFTHPTARETEPFFASASAIAQDARDDRPLAHETPVRTASPDPSIPWTPGPGPGSALSAHSMHPPAERRPSWETRRNSQPMARAGSNLRSNSQASTHRKPLVTRADSGREFWGLPEQPKKRIELGDLAEDSSGSEDEGDEEDGEWGHLSTQSLRRRSPIQESAVKRLMRSAKAKAAAGWKTCHAFMTVPMYAALLSIFIALIPPLQARMSQIKPFEQAIKSAGQCSIPVTLVVLGAFFYTPPPPIALGSDEPRGTFLQRLQRRFLPSKTAGASASAAYPGENKTVLVAVLSRMVIVPLLFLPFIALIASLDLFEAAEDPVFILTAVLLVSSPPALTLAQITQAASGDAFERLISKTISWSYAVLTPPLTLAYVVIGLVFGRL